MIEDRFRVDVIDQEQLAAQLVAIMDAHFQRPSADEKRYVLRLAASQLCGLPTSAVAKLSKETG
jgi:hypothetical protein